MPTAFPLTPFPDVARQRAVDEETVLRRWRPAPFHVSYHDREHYEVTLSYVEWAVPCPYYACKAEVGERCVGNRYVHARRKEAYRVMMDGVRLEQHGSRTHHERPRWLLDLRLRLEQRRAVVALESTAYSQTLANDGLAERRQYALDLGVDEAMVRRAVGQGHQRARRSLAKQRPKRDEQRARYRERIRNGEI